MSSWPIRDDASKVFPLYSRANVGEIFPDPISPLNASAGFQHNLEAGWRDAFVNCGVWDHDLYDASVERNILPAFGSYLYINMSLMRLFGVRVPGMGPEAVDLQYFGDMPGIPSYASERRDFDDNPGYQAKAGAWLMEKVLGATDLAEYDADRELVLGIRAGRPDLAALSDVELRRRITSFDNVLRPLFQRHIESSLKVRGVPRRARPGGSGHRTTRARADPGQRDRRRRLHGAVHPHVDAQPRGSARALPSPLSSTPARRTYSSASRPATTR